MPLLFYWKRENYYESLENGMTYQLNQKNELMHSILLGDSLWAITRNHSGHYVLAAELVVVKKTINPPEFRFGKYRVWGNKSRSRYFRIDEQRDIESVLRGLSCTINAEHLGQSFQGRNGIKLISKKDHETLSEVASGLQLERRARSL